MRHHLTLHTYPHLGDRGTDEEDLVSNKVWLCLQDFAWWLRVLRRGRSPCV